MRPRAWLALASIGLACGDFKGAASSDADAGGGDDASFPEGGVTPTDASDALPLPLPDTFVPAPDSGGDSPADFACTEPWTKPNRTQPGCATRAVGVMEQPILDTSALAIAVTGTKQIGIAY